MIWLDLNGIVLHMGQSVEEVYIILPYISTASLCRISERLLRVGLKHTP